MKLTDDICKGMDMYDKIERGEFKIIENNLSPFENYQYKYGTELDNPSTKQSTFEIKKKPNIITLIGQSIFGENNNDEHNITYTLDEKASFNGSDDTGIYFDYEVCKLPDKDADSK